MLFHNFAAFSLRRNGVKRKNSDTDQYLVCPTFADKTAKQRRLMNAANQFSNDLQWDPNPFSLQGTFKITDVVDIMTLSDLTT